MVVESTITRGREPGRDNSPSGPVTTCSTSTEPATIVNTTSQSAKSAGVSTTVAPSFSSGAHFSRVRLYTASA